MLQTTSITALRQETPNVILGSLAAAPSDEIQSTNLLSGERSFIRQKLLMNQAALRNANESDFAAIVRLNDDEVQHTSPMDIARLRFLDGISTYHNVAVVDGTIAAFLLAMQNGAPYVNDNFSFFASRYPQFVYVDRIVVAAAFARHKLGSLLYMDLFAHARAQGIPIIACEYNVIPPNEPSRRFHDKFGFVEVGTQWVASGTKCVSLQVAKT